MERSIRSFLSTYKWSVIGFLSMFIGSLLIITIGFWLTLVVLLVSAIGVAIGYLKDKNLRVTEFLQKLK